MKHIFKYNACIFYCEGKKTQMQEDIIRSSFLYPIEKKQTNVR